MTSNKNVKFNASSFVYEGFCIHYVSVLGLWCNERLAKLDGFEVDPSRFIEKINKRTTYNKKLARLDGFEVDRKKIKKRQCTKRG